jgi:hypothetical protein
LLAPRKKHSGMTACEYSGMTTCEYSGMTACGHSGMTAPLLSFPQVFGGNLLLWWFEGVDVRLKNRA